MCIRVGDALHSRIRRSFLLTLIKRNELGRDSGRKLLLLISSLESGRARSKASARHERAGHFSLLAQRKVTKRNGLPRRSKSGTWLVPGFSDSPSWLGRKTAGIHARRPPGVRSMERLIEDQERGGPAWTGDAPSHRRREPVPRPPHRLHHPVQPAGLERLAQPADVHVHRALLDVDTAAPDVVE